MSLELIGAIAGVFVGVAVIAAAAAALLFDRLGVQQIRRRVTASGLTQDFVLEQAPLLDSLDPKLQKLSKAMPKSPKDMGRLRKHLAGAGYFNPAAAVVYSAAELLLPVAAAGGLILWLGVADGWIFAIIVGVLAYLSPGLWLQHRTTLRRKAIQNGLPDALDLFIICMEAGSSLDQAIVKASEELGITHRELTRELQGVTTEIRAGKPRIEAFKNLAKRTGVDDVRALVSMLVQTDRFGTSVSQALRTHASNSRVKRRQMAEERARKIGAKLVFPLVLCLFPGVYLVCIGPAAIAIYRAL